MSYLHALLLGILQGLTEFLPISSTAHLILAREAFGWQTAGFGLPFDVALHLGTLVAILWYFRTEILTLVGVLPLALAPRALPASREERRLAGAASEERIAYARLARMLILATIPAVIVGGLWGTTIERSLRTPWVIVWTMGLGGVALLLAERMAARARDERGVSGASAFTIGLGQAAALVPGVSRSGACLTVALFAGLTRLAAARFTFLLGAIAIAAAGSKEALELRHATLVAGVGVYVTGFVAAAVVGYVTIANFLRFLGQHSLDVFAIYRIVVAGAAALWLVARA